MYRAQYFELKRLQILAKETVYHSQVPTGEKMWKNYIGFHDEPITLYLTIKVNGQYMALD